MLIALTASMACQGQERQKGQSPEKAAPAGEHQHEQQHGDPTHAPGAANEYMHQSSVDQLVGRFESEQRDAYQKPEKVMEYLGDLKGKTVMDIGAGSGYFSIKLADKGAHVIAADVDEEFQGYLSDRIQKNKIKNIETRKIPYDSPLLGDGEADMVFMSNTYHHIENREAYFAKVKKGTKNGGELVIVDFFDAELPVGPKHHKVSIDTVIDELKKAGYSQFEVNVNLLPYQYIIRAK